MKFKTNINCENCIRSVTPHLNTHFDIDHWEVDTNHEDKILTVEGDVEVAEVVELVEKAGFSAEQLHTN